MQQGPVDFSPQQAALASRRFTLLMKTHPEWFEEVGIFRLSGHQTKIQSIVTLIKNSEDFDMSDRALGRDEHIGILKEVLKNSTLISKNDPDVINLSTAILGSKTQDEASRALSTFIDKCARSGDKNKVFVAEILHNYLHILNLAVKQAEKNKMTASNLGIIIAPIVIDKILQISITNPIVAFEFNDKITKTCMPLISGEEYTKSFYEKYSEEVNESLIEDLNKNIGGVKQTYTHLLASQSTLEKSVKENEMLLVTLKSLLTELKTAPKKGDFKTRKQELETNISTLENTLNIQRPQLQGLANELSRHKTKFDFFVRQRMELSELTRLPTLPEFLPTSAPTRSIKPLERTLSKEAQPVFIEGEPRSTTPSPGTSPISSPPLSGGSSPNISPRTPRISTHRPDNILHAAPTSPAKAREESKSKASHTEQKKPPERSKPK